MARKLAHDSTSDGTDGESDGNDPPESRSTGGDGLERRQYVRLGGAAIASVLSLAGSVPALAAAEAGSGDAEHSLEINGSGTTATYELTVDGRVTPGANSSADAEARISECTAEGAVKTGERRYRFSGELRELVVDGDAAVTLDGVEVR
jgi:hypothetical protein